MNAAEGTTLAIATDRYEVHMADDGTSAVAYFRFEDMGTVVHDDMMRLLESMGFNTSDACGWIDVVGVQDGLTGALEWELLGCQ